MRVLKSICIAISTYSILPAPRCAWTEDNLRYAITALPLVGLFIGVALLLWQWLSLACGLGGLLFASVAALLPLAISGGIHMDGFCDTVDALASHQPQERKLEILRDSHVGAFAVIHVAAYLLICLGLYAELHDSRALMVVVVGFVLSRALTALTALTLRQARREGMLASIAGSARHKITAVVLTALIAMLAVALMLALHWQAGLCAALLCTVTTLAYWCIAYARFGGITGDTSGFFLQICELAILLGTVAGATAQRLA